MRIRLLFDALDTPLDLANPQREIVAYSLDQVRPALREVERAAAAGAIVVGYVAYEAAPAFDPALVVRASGEMPLVWFGMYDSAPTQETLVASDSTPADLQWAGQTTRRQYDADIASIHAAIAAGETYQVNYTLRLRAAFAGDGAALFGQLWRAQSAPYAALLDMGRFQVLSLSPELFFHRRGGTITTRPMKGTARRGRWPEEDQEQATGLRASEKNQAENLMIVDLLRNDIGRIAQIGSVRVTELFRVERYPTVWQMTSTVTAQERPGTTLEDVFAALFPCGSVTGAPKISTMGLIAELEQQPREVYCGAIGVVLPGGEAIFNVAIRTVVVDRERATATYGVGGAITYDSTADDEYAETVAKAAVLREQWPVFSLLETMRLKNKRITLLEGHLQRLTASAAYFGVPLDVAAGRHALREQTLHTGQVERLRLLVSQQGDITIEVAPLLALPPGPLPIALASGPVSRHDRFLFHKTTQRVAYDAARAAQPNVFDVLLWNEQGELTEFTIGNLVAEIDSVLWTPPRSCGLLNGVLRAALLRRGTLTERVLTRDDLGRATRLWLINSVRGWVEVRV